MSTPSRAPCTAPNNVPHRQRLTEHRRRQRVLCFVATQFDPVCREGRARGRGENQQWVTCTQVKKSSDLFLFLFFINLRKSGYFFFLLFFLPFSSQHLWLELGLDGVVVFQLACEIASRSSALYCVILAVQILKHYTLRFNGHGQKLGGVGGRFGLRWRGARCRYLWGRRVCSFVKLEIPFRKRLASGSLMGVWSFRKLWKLPGTKLGV